MTAFACLGLAGIFSCSQERREDIDSTLFHRLLFGIRFPATTFATGRQEAIVSSTLTGLISSMLLSARLLKIKCAIVSWRPLNLFREQIIASGSRSKVVSSRESATAAAVAAAVPKAAAAVLKSSSFSTAPSCCSSLMNPFFSSKNC